MKNYKPQTIVRTIHYKLINADYLVSYFFTKLINLSEILNLSYKSLEKSTSYDTDPCSKIIKIDNNY